MKNCVYKDCTQTAHQRDFCVQHYEEFRANGEDTSQKMFKGPALNTGKLGAIHELEACAYFLTRGYEVFRNVAQSGKADLILYKDGVYMQVDVTTGTAAKTVTGHMKYNVSTEKLERCSQAGIYCFVCYYDGHKELIAPLLPDRIIAS